jgi:hypothetical protein
VESRPKPDFLPSVSLTFYLQQGIIQIRGRTLTLASFVAYSPLNAADWK